MVEPEGFLASEKEHMVFTFLRTSRMGLGLVVTCLALALSTFGPTPALAATTCDGVVNNQVITGNLVVPDGAYCQLYGTTVTGGVRLGSTASFLGVDVTIKGNLKATSFEFVTLKSSQVNGGITLAAGTGSIELENTQVGGGLTMNGNNLFASTIVNGVVVGGNLNANDNSTLFLRIQDTQVGGNLRCDDNTPAPTGAGNTAARKTGQCAAL